ncbi:MAG: hypothetical protein Q8S21_00795 [Candidatus Paracaedibacteraceae bacterium]|nr:hypothetical protein [Candidatus Paracaedibacteraceae bacterium]
MFANGPDLVMETVNYDAKKNAYVVSYCYPKDVPNHEKHLKVQLSDIKVKEAKDDIGKYIVNLVAHPEAAMQSVSPQKSPQQSAQPVYPVPPVSQPQTVIVSPPAPRTETVIIEEHGPYYGPGYYGAGVVIGGVWGPHRYGGYHRHW